MMRRFAVVVLLSGLAVILLTCVAPTTGVPDPADHTVSSPLTGIEPLVRTFMRAHRIPGLTLGIVDRGEVVALIGFGVADVETRQPATPDTVFRAYSLAKVFTAIETVRLAQDGLIDLDSPIRDVLPEWPGLKGEETAGQPTVRQLLAHRGGVPRNSNYHENLGGAGTATLERQVASLRDAPAAFPPGYRYKYSNIGYNVLGRLIEDRLDQLFAIYMTNQALPAYGMESSAFLINSLPPGSALATGYVRDGRRRRAVAPSDIIELASGNLYTSASDLAQFMNAFMDSSPANPPRPLDEETRTATFVPQFSTPADPQRNGLGWMTSQEFMGELMVWHQGGDADANSLMAMLPDSRQGVCILTNTGSYEGSTLLTLAQELFGRVRENAGASLEAPPAAPTPRSDPEAGDLVVPADVTGRFVAYGEIIEILDTTGGLQVAFGPVRFRLRPEGSTSLGTEYSLHHWARNLGLQRFVPIDLSLLRLIVPPAQDGPVDQVILAVSDVDYEICPRYPDYHAATGASIAGRYDWCEIIERDATLRMTGVGYLTPGPGETFQVVSGLYAGETVTVDVESGSV
ncbi:MAG: class A beta-lactamase-related serine hydrolase, partial [Spirochaetales bacterium]